MVTLDWRAPGILREITSGATVVYTVVSRGRVLGTTEFEYVRCRDASRAGSFWPAPGVEHLMEIAVGVSPAIVAAVQADLALAEDRLAALELELRGPDGDLIETEWIGLQDTEFLLSLADADVERELDEEFADDLTDISIEDLGDFERELLGEHDPWSDDFEVESVDPLERPFPRYQVFVQLVDDASVP